MKIGIDLLWVKPGKSGGIESYIRNLLDGFYEIENENEYILIVSEDNHKTFEKYLDDKRFTKIICKVKSLKVFRRILWQNINLNGILKKNNITVFFEPIYSKPIYIDKKIKVVTTIHDLQALHYPQYFSKFKYWWLRFGWKISVKTSDKIVAISNFVKNDIINNYKINSDIVKTIYNPVVIYNDFADFQELKYRFNIEEKDFYYTVAQLLPHKNLETLIKAMAKIKKLNLNIPKKLLITGVNGKSKNELINLIKEYNLEEYITLTGYLKSSERNTLYKKSYAFLFSSVFEGFGMPPIEAMLLGGRVITTKETAIYEVTQGRAIYVNDPYNIDEWINCIENIGKLNFEDRLEFKEYDVNNIARKYLNLFLEVKVN
ncbi:glycosyltransferase family 1 protein [Clostridium perfringens]|nr:glycosyltransferase family 1 protein [Clostridium perfringens]